MTHRLMTLSIMTFCIIPLNIMTLSIMIFTIMTLSITTLDVKMSFMLSLMGFKIVMPSVVMLNIVRPTW
jgi:hypothetical protein